MDFFKVLLVKIQAETPKIFTTESQRFGKDQIWILFGH